MLSPNDLVYLPTAEDIANASISFPINKNRIYKMVSCTGNRCFFIKHHVANVIVDKSEFSVLNKIEKAETDEMIKRSVFQ